MKARNQYNSVWSNSGQKSQNP